jgi:hypothetical protein
MPNELPLPNDLLHLLEKRSSTDRRDEKRRAPESAEPDAIEANEKRSGEDRRGTGRRLDK